MLWRKCWAAIGTIASIAATRCLPLATSRTLASIRAAIGGRARARSTSGVKQRATVGWLLLAVSVTARPGRARAFGAARAPSPRLAAIVRT